MTNNDSVLELYDQGISAHDLRSPYVEDRLENNPFIGLSRWEKYVGEFKDGHLHGQDTYTFPGGKKYVGEFKDGNPWKGTEYDKDGNVTATYLEGIRVE